MSTLPHDPDSDDFNPFGDLLEYQQTDEFRAEADAYIARYRAHKRPIAALGGQRYRRNHPDLVKLRAEAEKYKPIVRKRQGSKCYWCGLRLDTKYELDHILPLIKGGTNDLDNLCVCHPRCNRKKGVRTDLKPAIEKQP